MNTERLDPPTSPGPGPDAPYRGRGFLDREARVPIAGEQEWIAFPGALKRALSRLSPPLSRPDPPENESQSRSSVGLLLHGPTRSGKTTLTAQILSRIPGARSVVFPGPFDAKALLEEVVLALDVLEVEQRLETYRLNPLSADEIEELLIELLDAHTSDERPLILVADHFDAWLRANDSSPKRLRARCVESATLLFRALRRTSGYARLIVTCRSFFTLPDHGRDLTDLLTLIEPGSPNPEVLTRLVATPFARSEGPSTEEPNVNPLQQKIQRACLDHLGLADLLTRSAVAIPEALNSALRTIEAYLDSRGEVPRDELPEVIAFFESLVYERLFQGLDISERDLLRLSTSFEAPAPLYIVQEFARRFSLLDEEDPTGDRLIHGRLAILGLWDFFESGAPFQVGHQAPGGAPVPESYLVLNPVARPRAGSLDDEERPAVAMHLIQLYVDAWLPEPSSVIDPLRCYQLCRLAVACGDPAILNRVLPAALEWLQRHLEDEAALHLGIKALQLLDNSRFEASLELLLALAQLCSKVGEHQQAARLLKRSEALEDLDAVQQAHLARCLGAAGGAAGDLEKAVELLQASIDGFEAARRPWDVAESLGALADLSAQQNLEAALEFRRREIEILKELGEKRRAITALGHLANLQRLHDQAGPAIAAHESALAMARELRNPELVTTIQGELARVFSDQGDLDRAAALQQERLDHFSNTGNAAGRAQALWGLARIELQRQRIDAAMSLLVEAYHINLELDRPEGIGLVGLDYGQVLWAAGMMGEARLILERAVQAFRRLGDAGLLAQAERILEELTTAS